MFIVTGASSGIGRGTAAALARRGIDVLTVARRAELLTELQRDNGSNIRPIVADLSTESGINELLARAETYGHVDGIVHAAGSLIPPADYGELRADELTEHFRIHVATPIEINNRLGALLQGSRLVYIDSASASDPRVGWSGYSIVKSAAQLAARAATEELREAQVVRIFPGGVRTQIVQAVLESPNPSPTKTLFTELVDAGTFAEPNAVGDYIARIALDATSEQLAEREFWDFNDPTSHL